MGGKQYVIPSLSVKQARALWEKIRNLNRGITEENYPEKSKDGAEVIHAALSRNYPDLTVDQVEDLVDMRNIAKILLIIAGQSGIGPGRVPVASVYASSSAWDVSKIRSAPISAVRP